MLLSEGFKCYLKRVDTVCLFILALCGRFQQKICGKKKIGKITRGDEIRWSWENVIYPVLHYNKATLPRSGIQINFKDTCYDYLI